MYWASPISLHIRFCLLVTSIISWRQTARTCSLQVHVHVVFYFLLLVRRTIPVPCTLSGIHCATEYSNICAQFVMHWLVLSWAAPEVQWRTESHETAEARYWRRRHRLNRRYFRHLKLGPSRQIRGERRTRHFKWWRCYDVCFSFSVRYLLMTASFTFTNDWTSNLDTA